MKKEFTYAEVLPYFILFFFLNNFLLPSGLLFTTLLSPLFVYLIYKTGHFRKMIFWGMLLIIPVPFHLVWGVNLHAYLISISLLITVWIFLFTAIEVVKRLNSSLEHIFSNILFINAILVLTALLFLPFNNLRDIFWNSLPISPEVAAFPRLKLLSYEPSHYALLLIPVILFFILKIITGKEKHILLIAIAAVTPLLLSFSFGVIGAVLIALLIGILFFLKQLPPLSKQFLIYGFIFLSIIILLSGFMWPENPLTSRLENIFLGRDTSAKGRLVDSFMFAWDLSKNYNLFYGVGPGQIKILAHDFIINFYQYTGKFADTVRIPNSMGEMLATYGLYGFVLKLAFEIYFFVHLRIYSNLYSLCLFIFIFIYQFTGSFLTNIAEIGIWAIVFQSRFSQFDYQKINNTLV